MKKALNLGILLMALISVISCDLGSSEFEKAFNHFETIESVKIEMVTRMPALDSEVTSEVTIDGDYAHISMEGMDIYEYMEDDRIYVLTQFGNNYMPEEIDLEEAVGFTALNLDAEEDEFDEADFELIDGWYVYQLDDGDFDEFKVKIVDDVITEIFFASREGGLDVEVTMSLSLYNEASIDFPDNVIDLDAYNESKQTLIANEFDFDFWENEASFAHGNAWISCDIENSICFFEEYPNINFEFDASGAEFRYNGGTYTALSEFYDDLNAAIDTEMFELILEMLANVYY